MIAKIAAAAVLLGMLTGCAGMSNWMPNWTPNAPADSMMDPPIYNQIAD